MASAVQNQASGGPVLARNYAAAERIAVVITILGEAVARPVLEKLDDATLAEVQVAISSLPTIPIADMGQIIREFTRRAQNASGDLIEKGKQARKLISEITTLRQGPAFEWIVPEGAGMGFAGDALDDVWDEFSKAAPARIGAYLNGLPPNLVSMILRKLAPPLAADVLCHLDAPKMRPVLGFMVQGAVQDPGIERVLERMIRLEFLNTHEEIAGEDAAHLGNLGEMLSLIPAGKRNELVDFLKENHQTKLDGIQKSLFTMEALPDMLPRNAVPAIFREMDTPSITRLMKSLEPDQTAVIEFILANISSRLANQVREDMAAMQSVSGVEAETLQRDFLSLLMRLKRSGAIEMG
jgi:flagellar motor switch protein FliG